jgi:3-deoxy-7-phosphoheptulonate synthase
MPHKTDDLRIRDTRPLIAPGILMEEFPLSPRAMNFVARSRRMIESILEGHDRRLLVVVGPCSIHDPVAAVDYARRLVDIKKAFENRLFIVMRVYFEKPRTVVGWKGLINDPYLDGSFQINPGLRLARKLLLDIAELKLPVGTEFLDTVLGQFYADVVSWGAIGARTTESQVHRELASGLSMPVGFKNRTDGDIQTAIDAIRASAHPHWFPSLTKEGAPAVLGTSGNPYCHLVLRGGKQTGTNYDAESVHAAANALADKGLPERIMLDCSHANSGKDPARQAVVAEEIAQQIESGSKAIVGVMIESNLLGGRQDLKRGRKRRYGQSITDACLSFDDTVPVLERLAQGVARGRFGRKR